MTPDAGFNRLPPPERAPNALAPAEYFRAAYPAPEEPEPGALPLAHYLWIFQRQRWKILACVAASVMATFVISQRLTPVYESTATIDVDRRMPSGVLGQDATPSAINDADQFLATQVKLIQSDAVLRPVAQQYRLVEAEGARGAVPAGPAADAPVALRNLRVVRPPNTYLLLVSYRSPDPRLAAEVANAVARSYVQRTYEIRFRASSSLSEFMEKQLEELRAKMERSSAALAQFERELNVINPEEKTSILSARLLQLNSEYTSAESERVKKEAAYQSVQGGSLEAAQASTQGEALKRISERLGEAQEKFSQIRTHYGERHPEYRRAEAQMRQLQEQLEEARRSITSRVKIEFAQAASREAMLRKAVADSKSEFDRLNARSFEYQALKREAEADKKLYEELTTRIKQASINAGFQNSAIRLADSARPAVRPVFPKLTLNLALAFLFSSLLAVGTAVLADVLDNTVRDPEQAQRALGTDVVGTLPLIKAWRRSALLRPAAPAASTALVPAAAPRAAPAPEPPASFSEAIHTLRNSILLGSFDRPLKSLLITSAQAREGKTTVAVHLAIAHAEQKRKTLLIDADLRRPGVARVLGIAADAGLATALSDGLLWRDRLCKVEGVEHLDVLPAGAVSRRAVDLLGPGLPQLLEEVERDYDLVVFDAPPLLGFPEPLQIAAAVDGVVVVSLAGQTSRKAIASVIATLQRVRANVVGLALNEVRSDLGDGYYYYGYSHHYYYGHRD